MARKINNLFYIYINALIEKFGMQRVTINLPDGRTMAGVAFFDREWDKDKIVPVVARLAKELQELREARELEQNSSNETSPE